MMQHLLFLHGAVGSLDQFVVLTNLLKDKFVVHSFNFSGHGGKPYAEDFSLGQFKIELFEFVHSLPEEAREKGLCVFGYSMGGYVAAMAAVEQPHLFSRLITLATKWHWDEASADKEASMVNPELIETKVPAFAQALASKHAPNNWKELLNKIAGLLRTIGQRPPLDMHILKTLSIPTLVIVGDRDKTVSIEETVDVYRTIPEARLAVLPGTAHPFEKVDTALLASLITSFIHQ
jgi:pimeloyl-ACP methyl ester carboxylesterase